MAFDIQEELKKLPGKPGVYLMHDADDTIIYVGKAISLKNRVRQYFQTSRNKGPKIERMVTHIARFEYIVTDSELEALVLECNLIKEHRPKYNTMLKDDKAYPYIKVTVNEDFPRILFSHQMKKDKAKYFGPYTSAGAVKDTIELLRKLYDIRSCNKSLPKEIGKDRPCLYYHIHQCKAPCQGYISKEEYGEQIKKAISFLNGNYNDMIKELTGKMTEAAEEMRFEQAAEYRDLIDSVRRIGERQKITNSDGEDKDVIALEVLEEMDLAIPVCGMVKDDKHRTRGLYFRNVEIPIDRNSEGFKLITRVQDEAHRFAIEYHRLLRSKGQVHSILDDIPGIGPTRRKELMRHFQGIDDIKAATVEELSGLPGMNKKAAEQVYTFFHAPAQEENEDSSK